jgi:dolichyl-phosphate beta-glucosyltransferase
MMAETMAYLEHRQDQDPTFKYEVIVVNDGSPDNTAQVALKFVKEYGTKKVRLLNFARNRGKGGAVRMVSASPSLDREGMGSLEE